MAYDDILGEFTELNRLLGDYEQATGEIHKLGVPYDALLQNPDMLVVLTTESERRTRFLDQAETCLNLLDKSENDDSSAEAFRRWYVEAVGDFGVALDRITGQFGNPASHEPY